MKRYKVTIKEVGRAEPLTPEYVCDEEKSRQFLVDFFGLDNPDVEWYKIECKDE